MYIRGTTLGIVGELDAKEELDPMQIVLENENF